jgi:hypothetical protein
METIVPAPSDGRTRRPIRRAADRVDLLTYGAESLRRPFIST